MTLAGTTNGGVTGHIAYRIQIDGKEDGVHTEPCGSQRCLNTRMTGTDDGNIAASCVIGGHSAASSVCFFSSGGRMKGLQTTSQRLMGVPSAWNFSS